MSNIPKLRFPEFSGEWEKSELGKFTQEITRVNSNSDAPIMMISAANGFILQSNKYSKEMTGQSLKKYIELHAGEFAYNHGASKLKKYGACFCLDLDKARIPFVYHCFKLTEGNTKFFSYLLNRTQLDSELARYISSSARMDGLLNISYTDYMKINISVPTLAEQQKIADFLSNVDSIITAETKILKTLQKKKKALMQKLFTRQLRFKSNDGTDFPAWEEKKFSEVFIYHQTNTFSRNMLNYEEGDTYNIHYGDILVKFGSYIDFDNSKIPFINSDVTLNKFVSDSFLKDGDIIIADTAEDESAGKVSEVYNINNKKALSGLHTILCRPKQIFASKYLGYFMNSNVYHKQIVKLLVGTKVLSINKSVIADTIIQIPCLAEQQKIADCLSSMDSLIQTQQKVVTTWQQRKKALLQQMFI